MSVTFTEVPIEPITLDGKHRIYLKNTYGLDVPFEWKYLCNGTGDGSAGTANININFADLNRDVYFFISRILVATSSSVDARLTTHTDRWELFHCRGQANEQISLWCGDSIMYTMSYKDQLSSGNPIYLGKVRNADAEASVCTFSWVTNTESEVYNLFMAGFATIDPLPLSCIPIFK